MLRRYSSRGLDGVAIQHRSTIGASPNCDIHLTAAGVAPVHATIEYHPLTRTYWLRDHSLSSTSVNGVSVVGQVELADGDLVRFGKAQPLVFQADSLVPLAHSPVAVNQAHANIDSSSWPRVANGHSNGGDFLPVLGQRIHPTGRSLPSAASGESARLPKQRQSRTRSDSSVPEGMAHQRTKKSIASNASTNGDVYGETPSFLRQNASNRVRSAGNELLQRVVRLQGELARRDEEMRLLRVASSRDALEDSLRAARRENDRLRELLTSAPPPQLPSHHLLQQSTPISAVQSPPPDDYANGDLSPRSPSFEYEVYRSFVAATADELRRFSESAISGKQREYADIFAAFVTAMDEPLAIRMLQVESTCEDLLSARGFPKDTHDIRDLFRDEKRETIAMLSNQLDALWPIVRDAMVVARDSARACVIFTTWSRQLGDQIRVNGLNSERLLIACDLLKNAFVEGRLSTHWLAPSLTPLLRTAALEMRRREDEVTALSARSGVGGHPISEALTTVSEGRTKRQRSNSNPVLQREVNLEVMAELQATAEEEKKKNELLKFEMDELQALFDEERRNGERASVAHQEALRQESSKWEAEVEGTRATIQELRQQLTTALSEKQRVAEEFAEEVEKLHDASQGVLRFRRSTSTAVSPDETALRADSADGHSNASAAAETAASASSTPAISRQTSLQSPTVLISEEAEEPSLPVEQQAPSPDRMERIAEEEEEEGVEESTEKEEHAVEHTENEQEAVDTAKDEAIPGRAEEEESVAEKVEQSEDSTTENREDQQQQGEEAAQREKETDENQSRGQEEPEEGKEAVEILLRIPELEESVAEKVVEEEAGKDEEADDGHSSDGMPTGADHEDENLGEGGEEAEKEDEPDGRSRQTAEELEKHSQTESEISVVSGAERELDVIDEQLNTLHELRQDTERRLQLPNLYVFKSPQLPPTATSEQRLDDAESKFYRLAAYVRGLLGMEQYRVQVEDDVIREDAEEEEGEETGEGADLLRVAERGRRRSAELAAIADAAQAAAARAEMRSASVASSAPSARERRRRHAKRASTADTAESLRKSMELALEEIGEAGNEADEEAEDHERFDAADSGRKTIVEREEDAERQRDKESAEKQSTTTERRRRKEKEEKPLNVLLQEHLLDRTDAPKGLVDLPFSSHIQSHINAATRPLRVSHVGSPLHVKTVQFKPPPPRPASNAVSPTAKPPSPILQPRFRF